MDIVRNKLLHRFFSNNKALLLHVQVTHCLKKINIVMFKKESFFVGSLAYNPLTEMLLCQISFIFILCLYDQGG